MRDDLKIVEIREKYDGQWVVVEITKVDKYDNPLRGRVLFNGANQDQVYRDGAKYRNSHSEADLYFFYAGQAIPTGIGVMFVQG
jgi:hypothetical protein